MISGATTVEHVLCAARAGAAETSDLESYGAVELFVASARRASPGFSLFAEKQWVARICQLVEGMPLGRIFMIRGEYAQAKMLHQDCLKRQAAPGARFGIVFALLNLGDVARLQGEHARAHDYYQQSIAIAKEIGQPVANAYCLWGLSVLAEMRGDYAEEKQLIQESKVLHPTYGHCNRHLAPHHA